jgi:hypothetical protein
MSLIKCALAASGGPDICWVFPASLASPELVILVSTSYLTDICKGWMYWIHFLILSRHTYLLLPYECGLQSHLRILSRLDTGRARVPHYYMPPHSTRPSGTLRVAFFALARAL